MIIPKRKFAKIIYAKIIITYLVILAVFTVISMKIDYLLTPEVTCVKVTDNHLEYRYSGVMSRENGEFHLYIPDSQVKFWSEEILLEVEGSKIRMHVKISKPTEQNVLDELVLSPITGNFSTNSNTQFVKILYTKPLGTFPQTVPSECIYSTDKQSYILLAEDTTSQFDPVIARKIFVHVRENDGKLAAIEGIIPIEGRVIQYANNTTLLAPGQKVRLA